MDDPSSEEELSTSDEEDANTEVSSDDETWCPPNPDSPDDPTEEELSGAAEKLETMMAGYSLPPTSFFVHTRPGALPALWLQAKLTISLVPFQEKFQFVARSVTIRVAEKLAKYICSLMRHAAALATPETECLFCATYWFRRSCQSSLERLRKRPRSIDVVLQVDLSKVTVTTQPHVRPHGGVNLTCGVSALLAWFPASWTSKIAPCFLAPQGAPQCPQEVAIPFPT